MLTLVAIGVVAGLVTGLSPCVLPLLPGILAVSSLSPTSPAPTTVPVPAGVGVGPAPENAAGDPDLPDTPHQVDRRRPYLIIAGLLTSFTLLTLLGTVLVAALGIPEGILRGVGVVALIAVGLGLLIPAVGHRLEALFYRIPQRGPARGGSAFLFGMTFGVAFVPCAGPVLAAITVLAATQGISTGLVVLTLAFAAGLAVPLLLVAHLGAGMGRRLSHRMPLIRRVSGAVLVVTGVALALGVADVAQRAVPGYVSAVQRSVEDSDAARAALDSLDGTSGAAATAGEKSFDDCADDPSELANCGPAPEFTGIVDWRNTPGDAPLTVADLQAQGKVVLVDFWTYSCINCQRTLPYLTAWDAAYRDAGLTIVGVHSPEFAFEREVDNVAQRAAGFGVEYPIAIDNDFATWRAYAQRYWPAHYLIDKSGTVRQVHYGEGAYAETEALIRELLAADGPAPAAASIPATAAPNAARTPETYLGYERARGYSHEITRGTATAYPQPPPTGADGQDEVTLAGTWTVRDESIEAGPDASLSLDYSAAKVFLVLGGQGTATVTEAGNTREIPVSGAPTLYELRSGDPGRAILEVALDEGMSAYAFTFG
ncbi:MAG: cytochrome c biogenesis protein DipZ [Candidatus Nanopelagicales bacterium]